MRVANQIIRKPTRALPATRTGNKAILTTDPNALNSNVPKIGDAHGVSGGSSCQVTLALGATGADITIWVWFAACAGKWVKLGSNSTQNTKTFDAYTVDGFSIPENTPFYIQGSVELTEAYTDAKAYGTLL